jgi:hypothetical protein
MAAVWMEVMAGLDMGTLLRVRRHNDVICLATAFGAIIASCACVVNRRPHRGSQETHGSRDARGQPRRWTWVATAMTTGLIRRLIRRNRRGAREPSHTGGIRRLDLGGMWALAWVSVRLRMAAIVTIG